MMSFSRFLFESGSMPGVGVITREEVFAVADILGKFLGIENPRERLIGSAGKKAVSGDIDFVVSDEDFPDRAALTKKLEEHPYIKSVKEIAGTILTAVKIPENIYDRDFVTDRPRTGSVQVDFMFVDDLEWSKAFYYSPSEEQSRYKGAHVNIALSTIAAVFERQESEAKTPDGRPLLSRRYKWSKAGLTLVERRPVESKTKPGQYTKAHTDKVLKTWKNKEEVAVVLGLKSASNLESFEKIWETVTSLYNPQDIEEIRKNLIRAFEQSNLVIPKELTGEQIQESALATSPRIQHLEDFLYRFGSSGVDSALSILDSIARNTAKITLKWDGSSLYFGRTEDGSLLLADNGGWNKKSENGRATSREMLIDILSRRANPSEDYIQTLSFLYSLLDREIPKSFRGIYKGEFLFGGKQKAINGTFILRPNKVTYEIDADTPFGEKMKTAEAGIVVHFPVEGEPPVLSSTERLFVIPPVTPLSQVTDLESSIDEIKTLIKKNRKKFESILDPTALSEIKAKYLLESIYRYINSSVYNLDLISTNHFLGWCSKNLSKTQTSKIFSIIKENTEAFNSLFLTIKATVTLKEKIIDAFEKGNPVRSRLGDVPGGEGWVVGDGEAKLVSRGNFMTAQGKLSPKK